MNTKTHRSNVEHLGRWLGGLWRGYMRGERQAKAGLVARGVPADGAVALLWVVKLGVLAVLFYALIWLALLTLFATAVAWLACNVDFDESEEWAIGEQAEHKSNPGYDPTLYNDAPDSRYADSRYKED